MQRDRRALFVTFREIVALENPRHGVAERLRIGDLEFRDALIGVAETDFLANQDGLIGTDVFSEFLVTLDFANPGLRLDPLPGL